MLKTALANVPLSKLKMLRIPARNYFQFNLNLNWIKYSNCYIRAFFWREFIIAGKRWCALRKSEAIAGSAMSSIGSTRYEMMMMWWYDIDKHFYHHQVDYYQVAYHYHVIIIFNWICHHSGMNIMVFIWSWYAHH